MKLLGKVESRLRVRGDDEHLAPIDQRRCDRRSGRAKQS
jgi:hypothetical protein